jgi:hypothetical protein
VDIASVARFIFVNVKTDSTVDSDPVIYENHRNRVRDHKHRFPLFSSVLELVTAGSDTLAQTLSSCLKLRVRTKVSDPAVTNSVPAVTGIVPTVYLAVAVRNCSLSATCCSVPYVPVQKTAALHVIIALALRL